jgi:hypothetical protein
MNCGNKKNGLKSGQKWTKVGILVQGVKVISGKRLKLTFIAFILLVLKQTIPQKKTLIFSSKMTL